MVIKLTNRSRVMRLRYVQRVFITMAMFCLISAGVHASVSVPDISAWNHTVVVFDCEAVPAGGPGLVQAAGANAYGQVGINNVIDQSPFAQVQVSTTGNPITSIVAVAAGERHTLMLDRNGVVWVAGTIFPTQTGGQAQYLRAVPLTFITDVKAIAAGRFFSLFLTSGGSLYGFGINTNGELGQNNRISSPVPVLIKTGVKYIAAGWEHAAAIDTTGSLYVWGDNGFGQLGDGTFSDSLTPRLLATGVKDVALGNGFTVYLLNTGTVRSVGRGDLGQLGIGGTLNKATPQTITGLNRAGAPNAKVIQLAAGGFHAMALYDDGEIFSWGSNEFGQLGNNEWGPAQFKTIPVQVVAGVAPAAKIAAGVSHSIAVTEETLCARGDVFTWGANNRNQLPITAFHSGAFAEIPQDQGIGNCQPLHVRLSNEKCTGVATTVTFEVEVVNVPNNVGSVLFDVIYPTDCLSYDYTEDDYDRDGYALDDWQHFAVTQPFAGAVRVNADTGTGEDKGTTIAEGSSATLLQLIFQVDDCCCDTLTLDLLNDDVDTSLEALCWKNGILGRDPIISEFTANDGSSTTVEPGQEVLLQWTVDPDDPVGAPSPSAADTDVYLDPNPDGVDQTPVLALIDFKSDFPVTTTKYYLLALNPCCATNDLVTGNVQGTVNLPPTAVITVSPSTSVAQGAGVTLSGTNSSDPEGGPLTYAWSITSNTTGASVSLSSLSGATTGFTAPGAAGTITVRLIVTDNQSAISSPASVNITVQSSVTPPPSTNLPPTANAGSDLTVASGGTVTLNGSGSDPNGDPITYLWSIVTGGGSITNSTQATATYNAPVVTANSSATIQLRVTDNKAASGTDGIFVGILAPGTQTNNPPTAVAGADQTVSVGQLVTLNGSGSSDPDGNPLVYHWGIVSGPVVSLSNGSAAITSFTAPDVPSPGATILFELTVSDGKGGVSKDGLSINVLPTEPPPPVNNPPVAVAGADQIVLAGGTVILDGSLSSDPDGQNLSYQWQIIEGGDGITINNANSAVAWFTAPAVPDGSPADGILLSVQLTVTDPPGASDQDGLAVRVVPTSSYAHTQVDGIYKDAPPDGMTAQAATMNAYFQTYQDGRALVVMTPDAATYYVFGDDTYADGFSNQPDMTGSGATLSWVNDSADQATAVLTIGGSPQSFTFYKYFNAPDAGSALDGLLKEVPLISVYAQTYHEHSAIFIFSPDLITFYSFLVENWQEGISVTNDLGNNGHTLVMTEGAFPTYSALIVPGGGGNPMNFNNIVMIVPSPAVVFP